MSSHHSLPQFFGVLNRSQHVDVCAGDEVVGLGGDEDDGFHVVRVRHVLLPELFDLGLHALVDGVHLFRPVEAKNGDTIFDLRRLEERACEKRAKKKA